MATVISDDDDDILVVERPRKVPKSMTSLESVVSAEDMVQTLRTFRKVNVGADGAILELKDSTCSPAVHYLSRDKRSWVIQIPNAVRCASKSDFRKIWEDHPSDLGFVVLMGKRMVTPRYSQSYGRDYFYAGQTAVSKPIDSHPVVSALLSLGQKMCPYPFNQCLINWYEADHHLGAHSDNESPLMKEAPIFSVSWGQCRRFRFTSKNKGDTRIIPSLDLYLGHGDVVIMGGACQQTHKHAVPPVRKKDISITERRINFTLRCFKPVDLVGEARIR